MDPASKFRAMIAAVEKAEGKPVTFVLMSPSLYMQFAQHFDFSPDTAFFRFDAVPVILWATIDGEKMVAFTSEVPSIQPLVVVHAGLPPNLHS